jgi:hypothetical protein
MIMADISSLILRAVQKLRGVIHFRKELTRDPSPYLKFFLLKCMEKWKNGKMENLSQIMEYAR